MALDLGTEGRGHRIILVFLGCRKLVRYAEQNRSAQVDVAFCSVYTERLRIALRRFPPHHGQERAPMTAIAAFLRKTPVPRLQDYFTGSGFTSLAPVDWTRPESEVVEPLIKAVDDMNDDEKQRVVMNAGQVAALADEPGQNALQNVVIDRAVFDTLEGANNRSLWVFLNEPDQFRKAEEVRYNDERRRGRSWSGFEVEKDRAVRRDAVSVAAFTKAIRDRFATPHVHVDVFDRHRVILDDQECDLVQIAVYREGRPEDMLEFDANSTLSRRIVKPVFEAALTYEADTGVIEVVANTLEDRKDLTAFMARDLLGIVFDEKHIPLREYDLSMLLKPFDFPTDIEDGITGVTVKELRFMEVGERNERITLESMSGADRSVWEMAEKRIGLDIGGTGHVLPIATEVPEWVITRARFTIKFHPGASGGRGKSLTLKVTMPHGCSLKDMTPHERLIGEKYLRRWGILTDTADIGDLIE
ncbi:hypothetical protein [Antarctobacter heliothermus]|nr:hypothetical protein [Antarctobacter heliothermus]